MKIACITSMYPTIDFPNGGVFVTKRLEALLKTDIEFDAYAVQINDDTLFVRLMKKIFKKKLVKYYNTRWINAPDSKVKYIIIDIKYGIVDIILDRLSNYEHQVRRIEREIIRNLKLKEYDIMHIHWAFPLGTAAVRVSDKYKIPAMLTCHGSDINILMRNKRYRNTICNTLNSANVVEFVSKKLMNTAIKYGYKGENCYVNPNGIEDTFSTYSQSNKSESMQIVGFVGNLIPIKRADKLPLIINEIDREYCDGAIEFWIIGDGELYDYLVESLGKMSNVKFWGRLSHKDVLERMKQMSVLMLPSRNEGWPCVVMEAFSQGTPVVGSNNGGIPEAIDNLDLVVDDGESFERRFAHKVCDVLCKKVQIDSRDLIAKSSNFKWDTLALKTIANYRAIENEK